MTVSVAAIGDAAVQHHRMGWPIARTNPPLMLLDAVDLAFGVSGNTNGLLSQGWSGQEDGACWATGARALLSLPAPLSAVPAQAYCIEIELAPFTAGTRLPAQRLAGSINGWRFTAPPLHTLSVLEIILPPAALARSATLDILFETPDAARPCDLLGGGDDRVLSFSFRRLRLEAVPTAPHATLFLPEPRVPGAGGLDDKSIMLHFESLGENCEFGLVQRQAGAEPLGLLRFTSAPLPYLLTGLSAGFAGMGAAGSVSVELSENGREYMVKDHLYGFLHHAGQGPEADPAAIAAREVQRLPFLVDKLLEDLRDARKIFVFHPGQPVRRRAANLLATAMAQHGQAALLWVEPASAEFPCGTVQKFSNTMFIGHLDNFAPAHNAHDFDYAAWRRLCSSCLRAVAGS